MDPYLTMEYLTMACYCALLLGVVAPFVDNPAREKSGHTRDLAGVCLLLAALCLAPALALGIRLFGVGEVLATLGTRGLPLLLLGAGLAAMALLVACGVWRAEPRQPDHPAPYPVSAEADADAKAVIRQHGSSKVLWRVDAPTLEGADLRGANLRGADLRNADLRGADLRGADLRGAQLSGPWPGLARDLHLAAFFSAGIVGVDLLTQRHGLLTVRECLWRFNEGLVATAITERFRWWAPPRSPVDARRACLQGADLRGAALVGARWAGAVYDIHTRWPPGFDRRRHGARWVSLAFRP